MTSTKRGAPKKDGRLTAGVFLRRLELVKHYQLARQSGKTDRASKDFAIAEIAHLYPEMKASKTELERALKEFQPNEQMKKGEPVFKIEGNENGGLGSISLAPVKYKSLRKPNFLTFGNLVKKP